ncbi:hypothetical protein QEH56_03425 [Pelagicoccus enzymogenes]|uniref:hypothetical protein n=1 Tax=Pelagicoccus enzymogenes TaxID=2773457 RepID=UPI00280DE3EF|nr:hypothetical protein [Pelagicoccus enzymogenes]MDQ8197179.1 hypothetical protein [Pelagicoccus enzymogenes]
MSHSLMLPQAVLALAGLYGATWFFLKAKKGQQTPKLVLAGATNLLVAAYLLCDIGMLQADSATQLVAFEKASTSLAIAIFALVPWITAACRQSSSLVFLSGHTALATSLSIANLLSPVSLRFESLQFSSLSPATVQSRPSLWEMPFLLLALLAATALLGHAMRGSAAGRSKLPKLLALTAFATVALPIVESQQGNGSHPAGNLVWIALSLVAISACALQQASLPPVAKKGHPSSPPKTDPSGPSQSDNDDFAPCLQKHALLLGLNSNDEDLASKLLANCGYQVMRESKSSKIPLDYLRQANTHTTVLFERDAEDSPPPAILELARASLPQLDVVALTYFPKSPRILREIRNGTYHHAIGTPLKAAELFQATRSQTLDSSLWIQPHHTKLS